MARVHAYVLSGKLGAALTDTTTTLTSAELAAFPVVGGSDYALVTIDPDELEGAKEVVHVTAHLSLATTATISRGQNGTTARAHIKRIPWRHQPEDVDYSDVEAQATVVTDLTDSTGATPASTLVVVRSDTAAHTAADAAANDASLNAKLKAVTDALKAAGIMASS